MNGARGYEEPDRERRQRRREPVHVFRLSYVRGDVQNVRAAYPRRAEAFYGAGDRPVGQRPQIDDPCVLGESGDGARRKRVGKAVYVKIEDQTEILPFSLKYNVFNYTSGGPFLSMEREKKRRRQTKNLPYIQITHRKAAPYE